MAIHYLPAIISIVILAFISVKASKLTPGGGVAGCVVGFLAFAGCGYIGLAILAAFFILATLATSWKKKEKQLFKSRYDQSTRRNAGQVLANGGVVAAIGLLAVLMPQQANLFGLMMAAALASATADTLSSELGMIYGRTFFNIVTLKKEAKGLDGVISFEGLFIGIIGSAVIATIYLRGDVFNPTFVWIICAGTIGNLADSFLGALLERKKFIGNDMVNLLNTLIAAIVMLAFVSLFA